MTRRKPSTSVGVKKLGVAIQELLESYRITGDVGPREQLVANYVPLVRRLCRRFLTSREPQEDLFQTGMLGLLSAIAKFDPDRGTSFSSLAIPEILGAILNYLRDHGSLIKVPRALRRNKLAPLMSAVLAVAFFSLLRSRLLNVQIVAETNAFAFAFGFLVGYFSDRAITRLTQVAEALLGEPTQEARSRSPRERR